MSLLEHHKGGLPPMDPQCHRIGVLVVTFVVAFLIVFGGIAGYALLRTPMYKATASVVNLPSALAGDYIDASGSWMDDVLLPAVITHLSPDDLRHFLIPYGKENLAASSPEVEQLLKNGRTMIYSRESGSLTVSFTHPNPEVAALMANDFAEQIVATTLTAAADAKTHSGGKADPLSTLPSCRITVRAVPPVDAEGPDTSLLIWAGFGAGLAAGALASVLMCGVMAMRRMPGHLPPVNGLAA